LCEKLYITYDNYLIDCSLTHDRSLIEKQCKITKKRTILQAVLFEYLKKIDEICTVFKEIHEHLFNQSIIRLHYDKKCLADSARRVSAKNASGFDRQR
ncbi:MAG: hypothetical protein NTY32_14035, partial [Bacteroidia bacterium]|nr:hypothetical protein [Bacteroidia bacterium]